MYQLFRKRVFILGPSHHVALPGCAVTQTSIYKTPLYDLEIDEESKSLPIFFLGFHLSFYFAVFFLYP